MKCSICGKKATIRLSPDLDIQGLGACKKHEDDMMIAYILLTKDGVKEYNEFIKIQKICAHNKIKDRGATGVTKDSIAHKNK